MEIRRLEASKLSTASDFYCADTEINWRVSLKDHLKLARAGLFLNLHSRVFLFTYTQLYDPL